MVMRLNKICLGITEVSLSNSPSLPTLSMWWEMEREKKKNASYITVTKCWAMAYSS